jgi:Aldehyde dehydrogenase family
MGAAPAASGEDVDIAVGAARRAFDRGPWPRTGRGDRADAMDRLAAALYDRAQDIARLVTAEVGMPITASRLHNAEVPATILRYYAALARALEPEEIRAAVNFRGHTIVRREPVGVSAVVAPWNYPLALAFSQLAPALAAGPRSWGGHRAAHPRRDVRCQPVCAGSRLALGRQGQRAGEHVRPRMPRRLSEAQVGVPAGAGAGVTAARPDGYADPA